LRMRVALIDVDGKLPNLALMKLSTYHKARGDEVILYTDAEKYIAEQANTGYDMFQGNIDKSYGAVLFSVWKRSRDLAAKLKRLGVELGGTGVSLKKTLPAEIEALKPDYSLYGIDYGIGFCSRGCIRNCDFCVVRKKEGTIRHVCLPSELVNPLSRVVMLLDNNFFADPMWREKCEDILAHDLTVNWNQGLDIRILTDEMAQYLARIPHKNQIHFAWDNVKDEQVFLRGLYTLLGNAVAGRNVMVYLITNYDSTIEEDLYRINVISSFGAAPYVMVYDKEKAPREIRHLQRWCNWVQFRKSHSFAEYLALDGKTENWEGHDNADHDPVGQADQQEEQPKNLV
jgi:hypothetical protein